MKTPLFNVFKQSFSRQGMVLLIVIQLVLLGIANASFAATEDYWQTLTQRIVEQIDGAVLLYKNGELKKARSEVVKAYFVEFEDNKMEAAIRTELGSKHAWKIEKMFGRLRKAIKQSASVDNIQAIATEIRQAIRKDAVALDQAGIHPDVFQVNQ